MAHRCTASVKSAGLKGSSTRLDWLCSDGLNFIVSIEGVNANNINTSTHHDNNIIFGNNTIMINVVMMMIDGVQDL